MFNLDIERKIVDFIKNSPLGVTSSDIAHYLGLNRMTIATYLAIIKEKALVDFKQMGMAKLWYVPVKLNKENYFNDLILKLGEGLNDAVSRKKVKEMAMDEAKRIEERYKQFYGATKMDYNQVISSLIDAQKKIGGNFAIVERAEDVITIKNTKCPFGERVKKATCLCATTSALCGVITARNLGYSNVVIKRAIARGSTECLIQIHLKKTELKDKEMDEYASA